MVFTLNQSHLKATHLPYGNDDIVGGKISSTNVILCHQGESSQLQNCEGFCSFSLFLNSLNSHRRLAAAKRLHFKLNCSNINVLLCSICLQNYLWNIWCDWAVNSEQQATSIEHRAQCALSFVHGTILVQNAMLNTWQNKFNIPIKKKLDVSRDDRMKCSSSFVCFSRSVGRLIWFRFNSWADCILNFPNLF